jgi:hypothetical protein
MSEKQSEGTLLFTINISIEYLLPTQSGRCAARRARPIAATRLANFHLVWFSTGTICLNVW